MKVLLDTTIQINRIFKPKEKEKINEFIKSNDCYCSTYVLGEFMANIVNDFVKLYAIMQIEDDLTEVYQKIADIYSPRAKTRMLYLVNDLARIYKKDYDLIKERISCYPDMLIRRFYYGIDKTLLNETNCTRAKAKVENSNSSMRLQGISCTKSNNKCDIQNFWKEHLERVKGMQLEDIPDNMIPVLDKLENGEEIPRGNDCRSMGDCIISLESLKVPDGKFLSTNKKDFEPICKYIGACLVELD